MRKWRFSKPTDNAAADSNLMLPEACPFHTYHFLKGIIVQTYSCIAVYRNTRSGTVVLSSAFVLDKKTWNLDSKRQVTLAMEILPLPGRCGCCQAASSKGFSEDSKVPKKPLCSIYQMVPTSTPTPCCTLKKFLFVWLPVRISFPLIKQNGTSVAGAAAGETKALSRSTRTRAKA